MAQRHSEQDLSHVQNPMLWVNWQAYLGKDFDTLPHALLCHFCPRTCSKYQHPPASLSTAKASFTVFFSKPLASQNKGRKEGRKEGSHRHQQKILLPRLSGLPLVHKHWSRGKDKRTLKKCNFSLSLKYPGTWILFLSSSVLARNWSLPILSDMMGDDVLACIMHRS